MKTKGLFTLGVVVLASAMLLCSSYFFNIPFKLKEEGEIIDSFNGVNIYYNGPSSHIDSRNLTKDGYNVGLKWQCVEFVKRYYLEVYNHKMPESFGNAVDYFQVQIADGELNSERGLVQCTNPSNYEISIGDILIFSGGYGHVAIVSDVQSEYIEVVQQNVGVTSRDEFYKRQNQETVMIEDMRILGWLKAP